METLVVGIAAGVLLLCLLAGWAVVRRWRPPNQIRATDAPGHWRQLIGDQVPLTARLTEEEWSRLLGLVHRFVREKNFEGIDGLVLTEAMQVIIAAQACLLLLHIATHHPFPGVKSVIVYPGTFVPRVPDFDRHMRSEVSEPVPTLGESLKGAIVLSWESVEHGLSNPGDGHNVVLHEFAHQLDQEDGYVDGIPLLEAPSSIGVWSGVLRERFAELQRKAEEGEPDLLNFYGATNRAEFFAVATETFFERPAELRDRYPDLYRELKGFYRQDPAERG